MFILIFLSIALVIYAFAATGKSHLSHGFDIYFFLRIFLAILFAILPMREVLFERKLGIATERFLGKEQVIVDCKPYFDFTLFSGVKGYVFIGKDAIYLEARTCDDLHRYINDPKAAGRKERFALHVLTHEAMHVAGTKDEIRTDCQAYQRNHHMSMILEVPRPIAITHARQIHRERSPYHEGYYSPECEPGRELDEYLPDAVWLAKGEAAPPIKEQKRADSASSSPDMTSEITSFITKTVKTVIGFAMSLFAHIKTSFDAM